MPRLFDTGRARRPLSKALFHGGRTWQLPLMGLLGGRRPRQLPPGRSLTNAGRGQFGQGRALFHEGGIRIRLKPAFCDRFDEGHEAGIRAQRIVEGMDREEGEDPTLALAVGLLEGVEGRRRLAQGHAEESPSAARKRTARQRQ